MKQRSNCHEPITIDVDAANAPVADTPYVHTLNGQQKKNNENIILCQEEAGKYLPRCRPKKSGSTLRQILLTPKP